MKKIINEAKALQTFKWYLKDKQILEKTTEKLSKFTADTEIELTFNSKFNEDNNIFICPPSEIIDIKNSLDSNKEFSDLKGQYDSLPSSEKDNLQNNLKAYNDLVIFFENLYKNFQNNKFAYEVMIDLGLRACPYCNLNYIDAVVLEDDRNDSGQQVITTSNKILRPHFDHWLPQSKYPFFSLSFYNLIPSCNECNSPLKSDNLSSLYPYIDDFDNLSNFEIEFEKEIKHYNFDSVENIKITLTNQDNKKIKEYCELFSLEERYKYRRDYACEILARKEIYNDDMVNEISRRLLDREYPQEYIDAVIWGNYIDANLINKRPLSKLTKDILNQLKKYSQ